MPNTEEWGRQVRDLAKEVIPSALETSGPMDIRDIYAAVSAASNGLCDDSIPCQHEKLSPALGPSGNTSCAPPSAVSSALES